MTDDQPAVGGLDDPTPDTPATGTPAIDTATPGQPSPDQPSLAVAATDITAIDTAATDEPPTDGSSSPLEHSPEDSVEGSLGDSSREDSSREDSSREDSSRGDSSRDESSLDDTSLDDTALGAALEAVLLVVDEPVGEITLAQTLEQPVERVAARLKALAAEYTAAGRGFDLRRAAGGWRLYTRPEQAPYVERFVLDGQQSRLTQAALETLAVVAYKQPVTRSRVAGIRGVNCDGVIRTLLTRGLVEEAGSEPETGAHLYRTTSVFLEKLGLDSVDQLPPLAPFLPEDTSAWDPDVRAEVTLPQRRSDRGGSAEPATPAAPATNGSEPFDASPAAGPPAEEPPVEELSVAEPAAAAADGYSAEEPPAGGQSAEEPPAGGPATEEPRGEAPGDRDVLA